MARTRKRVRALCRAPDGSAFHKCDDCGVSVAVALADMHRCKLKKGVKRFRGLREPHIILKRSFQDQPRSAFCFFMESFMKTCQGESLIDLNRKGCEIWKNMPMQEQRPYILQAEKVNSAYLKNMLREVSDMPQADDEADSAWVGKLNQYYEDCESSEYTDSHWSYCSEQYESLDTYEWKMMCPWAA